jgi:hypothetical protein
VASSALGAVLESCWMLCFWVRQCPLLIGIAPAAVPTGVVLCVSVAPRRPDQHEESHPEGALSVPMYRRIDMGQADFAKVRDMGGTVSAAGDIIQ